MSQMRKSGSSVQPQAKKTVNWPTLQLPPKSEKFGEGMTADERQALEQHSNQVKSTLDQHLNDLGSLVSSLQTQVADLQAQLKAKSA